MTEIQVLDKGFVRLDDSMADDLSVVNSARVSFAKRSTKMTVCGECGLDKDECGHGWHDKDHPALKLADVGLIKFLMKNRHGTPFEHNAFRFHCKVPIFVMREWIRHRISSYNEMSGRYVELPNEFYIPALEDVRGQVGKPGAYRFEPVPLDIAEHFVAMLEAHYARSFDQYRVALGMGVAKELARLFLPVGIYTEFYWTVNARSLMNFLSLRNDESAQYEIRQFAKAVEELFKQKMPITAEAFIENERKAP